MCQACQKPDENTSDCLDIGVDAETLKQLENAAKVYRERAAETDRIINQLIIGACILGVTLAIFALIYHSAIKPNIGA